jgi:hypothetical protein
MPFVRGNDTRRLLVPPFALRRMGHPRFLRMMNAFCVARKSKSRSFVTLTHRLRDGAPKRVPQDDKCFQKAERNDRVLVALRVAIQLQALTMVSR